MTAKQSQQSVQYRRGYPMKQCSVCAMYVKKTAQAPFGSCTAVSGSITPFGLCNLWSIPPLQSRRRIDEIKWKVKQTDYSRRLWRLLI
jgi:hypothetical protein